MNLSKLLHAPFAIQLVSLTFLVFFLSSFHPPYFLGGEFFGGQQFQTQKTYFTVTNEGFLTNNVSSISGGIQEIWEKDEAGNLIQKIIPKKRDKRIEYKVKKGDNISKIAHKFNLKVSTLLWANKMDIKKSLSIGANIVIPPTDGVFYKVRSLDTLGEIAKTHDIELEKILAYNDIKNNLIRKDQELFLPEARKIFIQKRIIKPTYKPGKPTTVQSIGLRFRRPTKGILTQGYHRGHYALDIANKLNTPIYAASSGIVVKSSDGWNYGYGKYIIIDHGNNILTLYGHNNIRKVSVGDPVKAGQLIALMGNSGNVWGPTGIHLHFEIRIRGRKVNPNTYFSS